MGESGLQHLFGLLLALGDGTVFLEGPGVQTQQLGKQGNACRPACRTPLGCLGKALPGIEQTAAQSGGAAQVQIELGQVATILAGSQQLLGLGVNADRTLQRFGSTRVLGLGQHGQIGRQLAQQGLKQCRVGLQRDSGKTGFLH